MPPEPNGHQRIHTVDLLEQGIALLEKLGYQIRIEAEFGRSMICRLKGKSILVLDPEQTAREQLDVVLDGLRSETSVQMLNYCTPELRSVIEYKQRAA
jgi:hypothetical protein